ncbi:hypothetical protein BDE02_08G113500 [Populus trichocarpa]|nr:hypothetical protein BDE02_08G113500 [Populus trichocarpa]
MGGTQTSQEYQSHVNVAEEEQKGSSLESIVKLPIDCFFGEPLAELLVPSNSGTQGNVVFLLWLWPLAVGQILQSTTGAAC